LLIFRIALCTTRTASVASIFLLAALVIGSGRPAFAQDAATAQVNLAPTPPMGWASWNHFFCDYNEQTIREQADALVSSGMRDLGYKYVLIQECIAPGRTSSGQLIIDPTRFPHGMAKLVDYIHARGLKAGIYTDVGRYTCFPNPRYEGSYDHETQDAETFASFGMDFVEMDYCNRPTDHTGREIYERMAAAIQKTGRPMLFYICSWGNESPWTWAQGKAQLWRTDRDISPDKDQVDWTSAVKGFESNARHAVFSAPSSWNDPDMLEVGNPGLNLTEAQTHFAMWAVSAAPLWAGNDLTHMTDSIRKIYANPEVVAIDQDSLGASVMKVREDTAGMEVWSKPLESVGSGVQAVLLLNLSDSPATVAVKWSDLGLSGQVTARDLYSRQDVTPLGDGYSRLLPAHGSALLKVTGTFMWSKGATYEAEWPGNSRSADTVLVACPECSQGYAVGLRGADKKPDPSTLKFTGLRVPASGKYSLTIHYVYSGLGNETLQMQVDDGAPVALLLRGYIYGSQTVPVELTPGRHSIAFRYQGPAGTDVNIDRLALYQ
jgi:alpha-galactosidase